MRFERSRGNDAEAPGVAQGQGGPQYTIAFQPNGADGLRAHVEGTASLETTIAYWRAILAQLAERRSKSLLLIDELRGEPLDARDWQRLVQAMTGKGLEQVRIAHVKPHGLERIEYCEIYANEAGLHARVFDDERAASLWLRYGESAPE
jgi:hypothetical protein